MKCTRYTVSQVFKGPVESIRWPAASCPRVMDWPYAVITARNAAYYLQADTVIRAEEWTPEGPLTVYHFNEATRKD
jgi:hypothetical protein